MTIQAKVVINTGLYMHIEAEIPLEVPDDVKGKELIEWLHTNFKGLLESKEKRDAELQDRIICENCGAVMEKKTFDGLCSKECQNDIKYKLESKKITK